MMWDFSGGRRSPQPPPPIRMPSPAFPAMHWGHSAPTTASSYPPLPVYGASSPTPQSSGSDAYPPVSPFEGTSRSPSRPVFSQYTSPQGHHVVIHHSKHHTKSSHHHHHRERRHSHSATVPAPQPHVPQVPIHTSQSQYLRPPVAYPPRYNSSPGPSRPIHHAVSFELPPKKGILKPPGSGSKPAPSSSKPHSSSKPSSSSKHAASKPSRDADCYSRCTGKRKALCIGINYTGQENELRGCINDAKRVREFLIKHGGYRPENILMLTDEAQNPNYQPTKRNIKAAMRWLVKDARTDDALFFHYSGHGGQTRDLDGDEVDGWDEVIYPLDFRKNGHIVDDEMHDIMVKPLPKRCRLTAIFDACHSGTVLDLPYIYSSHGRLKGSHVSARARRSKESHADVISWSGCKDGQTSADTFHGGVAVGAMSHAFTASLTSQPKQSYQELLTSIRRILHPRFSQKPQLGSSHHIDTGLKFVF